MRLPTFATKDDRGKWLENHVADLDKDELQNIVRTILKEAEDQNND